MDIDNWSDLQDVIEELWSRDKYLVANALDFLADKIKKLETEKE